MQFSIVDEVFWSMLPEWVSNKLVSDAIQENQRIAQCLRVGAMGVVG